MTTITPATTAECRKQSGPARILVILGASILAILVMSGSPASAAGLSDPSVLTKYDGSMTITEDGAVIENLEIKGTLRIEANNVLVRNVWVYGSEFWSVYVASGSARFENVEIGHASYPGSRGIGGNNVVGINLHIHHVEDGIKLGSNSTYSGVKIHDLASPASSPHTDAVQVESGSTNSIVKNSSLSSIGPQGLGNAAVIVKSDLGFPSNIQFVNNYMNGGNYTVYVRDGGYGMPANISFTGNRFGRDSTYGFTSLDGPVGWEDNTWYDTGELIDSSGNVIGGGTTTTTQAPPTTTTTRPRSTTTTTKPSATTTSPSTTLPSTTTTTTSDADVQGAEGSSPGSSLPGSDDLPPPDESNPKTTPPPADELALGANDDDGDDTNLFILVFGSLIVIAIGGFFIGEYLDASS